MRTSVCASLCVIVAAACGQVEVGNDGDRREDAAASEADAAPEEPDAPAGEVVDLVDDLEDGDDLIYESSGPPERKGYWYTANDGTGTQEPAPLLPVAGGAEGSKFSMRTTGSGFTDWGAKVAFYLNNEDRTGQPFTPETIFDVTDYRGIRFQVRGDVVGDGTANDRIFVLLVTTAMVRTERGGQCEPVAGPRGGCDDYFGAYVQLTEDWQEHEILFDDIDQRDFGQKAVLDKTTGIAIEFEVEGPVLSFDVSVDNVELIKAPIGS